MSDFPHRLRIDLDGKKVTFLVPKFHLPAHVAKCQTSFSFNLTCGVRRTDGEAPERGWSNINPLSSQTKQMGPALRCETINDHFGDWNHKKVIWFGTHNASFCNIIIFKILFRGKPFRQDSECSPCACTACLELFGVYKVFTSRGSVGVVADGGAVGTGSHRS
jgi:hypothetical protein